MGFSSLVSSALMRGREVPPGTKSVHGGKKVVKNPDGEWVPDTEDTAHLKEVLEVKQTKKTEAVHKLSPAQKETVEGALITALDAAKDPSAAKEAKASLDAAMMSVRFEFALLDEMDELSDAISNGDKGGIEEAVAQIGERAGIDGPWSSGTSPDAARLDGIKSRVRQIVSEDVPLGSDFSGLDFTHLTAARREVGYIAPRDVIRAAAGEDVSDSEVDALAKSLVQRDPQTGEMTIAGQNISAFVDRLDASGKYQKSLSDELTATADWGDPAWAAENPERVTQALERLRQNQIEGSAVDIPYDSDAYGIAASVALFTNGYVRAVRKPGVWKKSSAGVIENNGVNLRGTGGTAIDQKDKDGVRVFGTKDMYGVAHNICQALSERPYDGGPGPIYRGMKLSAADVAAFQKGHEVDFSGVRSFSTSDKVAWEFADEAALGGTGNLPAIMVVHNPKNGTTLTSMSEYPDENEVISSGKVKVVGVSSVDSKTYGKRMMGGSEAGTMPLEDLRDDSRASGGDAVSGSAHKRPLYVIHVEAV